MSLIQTVATALAVQAGYNPEVWEEFEEDAIAAIKAMKEYVENRREVN